MPVADWGTATVGRMVLREGFTLTAAMNGTTGRRSLTLTGEESSPPLTVPEVKMRQEDILSLQGKVVVIRFSNKDDHNGVYQITDADTNLTNWTGEVVKFGWQIQAEQIGATNSVDFESRLAGGGRANLYALAGERWHAPSASAYGYYTPGGNVSGTLARALAGGEGTITLYRGIPTGSNPRWGSISAHYRLGRVRFLQPSTTGYERTADGLRIISASTSFWSLENGLLRVEPGTSATLQVSAWNGSAWNRADWNVSVSGSATGAITTWDAATVLRNDYEMVTVRLVKDRAPGRTTLDLSLRRGSRFVETYLQTDSATTKSWYRATAEAGTAPASAAYVTATANDAAGDRYIIASLGGAAFTAQTPQGGITKAAVTALDAAIGTVVGGSAATSGNQAADLRNQYVQAMSERTVAVKR